MSITTKSLVVFVVLNKKVCKTHKRKSFRAMNRHEKVLLFRVATAKLWVTKMHLERKVCPNERDNSVGAY